MGLAYTIVPNQQLIIITGEYAEPADWRELLQQMLDDPRRTPGCVILRDLRGASTPIGTASVVQLMEVVRQFWPLLQPARAAILTPHEFDAAAMVAHALADTHGLPIRVFNSVDAAMEWLMGAPDPEGRLGPSAQGR